MGNSRDFSDLQQGNPLSYKPSSDMIIALACIGTDDRFARIHL